VEDNPINAEVAREVLIGLGHEVVVANDGLDAMATLRSQAFDCVLMDLEMPRLDGLQATVRIRRGEAGAQAVRTPVIGLSAHALEDVRENCMAAGMDSFNAKPLDFSRIQLLIREVLARTVKDEGLSGRSAPESQAGQPAVLDREGALARLRGNAALLDKVTRELFERLDEALDAIRVAIEGRETVRAAELCHGLAGSLASIGAEAGSALCRKMMKAGRAGNLVELEAMLPALLAAAVLLRRSLDDVVQDRGIC